MYQWQRIHIFDELEENNHKVITFNDSKYTNAIEANDCLVNYLKRTKHKIDLFVTAVDSNRIFKQTIQEIKGLNIPTLLICFDNLHAPYSQLNIAPLFDLVWLTSRETENLFTKTKCNTVTLPYAANPSKFHPTFKNEINSICFVGSLYGTRLEKINDLLNNNIFCDVYSGKANSNNMNYNNILTVKNASAILNLFRFKTGQKVLLGALKKKIIPKEKNIYIDNSYLRINTPLSFNEMIYAYSNHSLSLNITELRNTYRLKRPVHKLHLRTFEIPMCGGIQFSSYTPELSEYFEDEKEIVMFKSTEEMISKAKFYLSDKNISLRQKIRANARKRCINEHTWTKRFNVIFNKLNIH